MSVDSVRDFFESNAPDLKVIELDKSTATVALAAEALRVQIGQIAKTLSLVVKETVVLIVCSGEARLDNRKYKEFFGVKAKMLDSSRVESETSHPIGGVTPFGVPDTVQVFCDKSLLEYDVVFPAGGAKNAAVQIEPARIAELVRAEWIDVTQ